jgi:hypothetical protein
MLYKKSARCQKTLLTAGVILIPLMVMALITACSPYPSSPEKVIMAFSEAVAKGDMKKAESFCSDKLKDSPEFVQMKQFMSMAPDSGARPNMSKEDKKQLKDLQNDMKGMYQSSIEGNTAKVWMQGVSFVKYTFVKEGMKWKLDGIEINESEMMKSVDQMMKGMPGM